MSGVGKTSLVNTLLGKPFNDKEPSTDGIVLRTAFQATNVDCSEWKEEEDIDDCNRIKQIRVNAIEDKVAEKLKFIGKQTEEHNSAPKPAVEPVTEPAVEPVTEPAAEPIPEPAVEPISEQAVEPVTEEAAEPILEPEAEPISEPAVEPIHEPAGETIHEPAAEQIPEPTVEPDEMPEGTATEKSEACQYEDSSSKIQSTSSDNDSFENQSTSSDDDSSSSDNSSTEELPSETQHRIINRMLKPDEKKSRENGNEDMTYIWDFAGQQLYYITHRVSNAVTRIFK
ncbi:protein TsetseEP-like [Anneissia japonica]|uniref:protein TsetseEP-like n=1 Tax=Anneissia japonica TaxID=1529436 RepID=UPI001425AE82|nr:protein TsetseEP-like [Anneissia japonica]